jgi:hypothetical protein
LQEVDLEKDENVTIFLYFPLLLSGLKGPCQEAFKGKNCHFYPDFPISVKVEKKKLWEKLVLLDEKFSLSFFYCAVCSRLL